MELIDASSVASGVPEPAVRCALDSIVAAELRDTVGRMAVPRHCLAEPQNNQQVAEWILGRLQAYGLEARFDGPYRNVVAIPVGAGDRPLILVGAHYDSVPGCPGADDNASAVAAMLACARTVMECAPEAPVGFVAFNREEDGLIGSADFVSRLGRIGIRVGEAHILEMVGYTDTSPGSQRLPAGLPVPIPDTGDFLGLVANQGSHAVLDGVLTGARTYVPELSALGLKLPAGAERMIGDVLRSDHAPFWAAGIPALMWTDTADFRNPHYHRDTDVPETLDYAFLTRVTQLLVATVLTRSADSPV